jgi:phage terminase small subunit
MDEEKTPLHTNKATVVAKKRKIHRFGSNKSQKLMEAGDIQGMIDSLSTLQKRFCEEYLVDLNATQATIRAGYQTKWPSRVGSQLLRTPTIKMAIESLIAERNKSSYVGKDEVLKGILRAIQKAEAKDKTGDMLRGYELLAKHLGMFIDRTEISGPDGEAIQMEQKTKQNAEEFTNKLLSLSKKANSNLKIVENDE